MIQKVLITGGAGFIGSNFVRYFLQKYPSLKIINLDKLTYCGNLENLKDISGHPNYQFVQVDICDQQQISLIMAQVDAVIHFAAESHVDNSIQDPYIFTKTNVLGTHVLLQCAKDHNIQRFLHMSTDEVYGSIEEGSFVESDQLNPSSPYSASKAAAELIARGYITTFELPVVIARCSNAFGPYQYPEKVIPLFITNLLEDKKVPLYGDGKHVRSWIHVSEVCKALDFIFWEGQIGEIYNIPSPHELQNIELTKKILTSLEKDFSFIQHVPDRLAHDRRYSINGDKLAALGFTPQLDFDTALQETVLWYRENPQWWKRLKKR